MRDDPRPRAAFLYERQEWGDDAACLGTDTEMFFTPREKMGRPAASDPPAWEAARAVCAGCKVRTECGSAALREEDGVDVNLRFGLRAYMTPEQRLSIERRGGLRGRDPMHLVLGKDGTRKIPPVPDDGDRWSRHHTTLARKVVRWLVDNVPVGEKLPSQQKLCDVIGCNPAPLRRVMEALVQEGTLDFSGTKVGKRGANQATVAYVRRRTPRAVGSWLPTHISAQDDEGDPCD